MLAMSAYYFVGRLVEMFACTYVAFNMWIMYLSSQVHVIHAILHILMARGICNGIVVPIQPTRCAHNYVLSQQA